MNCHSDRGSQYASGDYQELIAQVAAVCSMKPKGVGSMSRKGNCYDNAPVESFFASMKRELVHRRSSATHKEVRNAVLSGLLSGTTGNAAIPHWDISAPNNLNNYILRNRCDGLLNFLSAKSGKDQFPFLPFGPVNLRITREATLFAFTGLYGHRLITSRLRCHRKDWEDPSAFSPNRTPHEGI